MHADRNEPIRSFETGGYNCCVIFLSGYRFPSEVGQVRLSHIMSFHRMHTQTCVEVTLNVINTATLCVLRLRLIFEGKWLLFLCSALLRQKTHNSRQHMEPATPIDTFAIFSFPTILPTADVALFSLQYCGHPKASSLRKRALLIACVENP